MTLDFAAITKLSAAGQLQTLYELQEAHESGFTALKERPDFKKMADAPDIDRQMAAYEEMSEETSGIWRGLQEEAKEIRQLRFHLYANSPHEEVRAEMRQVVDAFISEHFSENRFLGPEGDKVTEISYYHGLLYLSTFGGKMTDERSDVWHLAYEFNAQNSGGYQPAVPWNPMENLFEGGMTRVYAEETYGNNLTPIGTAVLARLNERFGEPEVVKTFVQKAGGQGQAPQPET